MTKNDAKMFMDICDFIVRNDFVFYDDSVEGFEALNYSNLPSSSGLRVDKRWA